MEVAQNLWQLLYEWWIFLEELSEWIIYYVENHASLLPGLFGFLLRPSTVYVSPVSVPQSQILPNAVVMYQRFKSVLFNSQPRIFTVVPSYRRTPSRSDRLLLILFVLKWAVGTSSATALVPTPQRHRGDSVLLLPWYLPVYVAGILLDLRGVEYVSTWVVAVAAQLCGASRSMWIDLAVPSY